MELYTRTPKRPAGPRTRTGSSPLRARHRHLTRSAIIDALADLVAEEGVQGFTVQELADRAQVSYASVYKHFATRKSLLDALYERGGQALALPRNIDRPASLEDLFRAPAGLFEVFATHPSLVRGLVLMSLTVGARAEESRQRDRAVDEVFRREIPGLGEKERRWLSVLERYLVGSTAWVFLTQIDGLSTEDAAEAVSWAMHSLVTSARKKGTNANSRQTRARSGRRRR